jgi:HEAT repeat protein
MDVLLAGLLAEDYLVQADAARLLGELGRREAVGPLVKYVTECRNYAKVAGLEALARIGDKAACPALRRLVEWPNVPDDWYWYCQRSVRAAAAVALLALGEEGGAPYLHLLADKQDDVFFAWFAPAILRLGKGPPAAVEIQARITPEAVLLPGSGRTRYTNPGTAAMAAEALGLLATPRAREQLHELARHWSRYVRGRAAMGLAARGAPEVDVLFVEELAEGDATDFVRIQASLALAKAGKAGWAEKIAAAAGRLRDPFDLAVAVEAVGLSARSRLAPAVRKRLSHADPYVRQTAVEALNRLGGDPALVRGRVRDPSPRVRLSAAKFLAAREGGRA